MYLIKQKAEMMGLSRKGNMIVERILTNPVYAGLLKAEAFKNHPAGLFPGIHEPIIDLITWKMIQSKFKRVIKPER